VGAEEWGGISIIKTIMKKKIILLFFGIVNVLNAQQKEISYDFMSKKLILPQGNFTDEDKLNISIKNFNPFLYTYAINTKKITFNSEIPKLLKNGDGGLLSLDQLLETLKNLQKENRIVASDNTSSAKENVLKTMFKIDLELLKFYDPNYIYKKEDKISEALLKELLGFINKLPSDIDKTELTSYLAQYVSYLRFNAFFNEKLFNKQIEVGSVDADLLDVSFVFKPITTTVPLINGLLSNDSISISLPIQRKKGYLTYSTGLFISGLGNPTYAIQNKKIIEEEGSGNAFGFNALAHYMWDVQKNTALGFHLGLGTPFLKGSLSLVGLAGVTAAFGKKNRFLINTGPTFGMIKVLSSANYKDEKKDTLVDGLSEVKTYQKLKANWAFSITYNLNK